MVRAIDQVIRDVASPVLKELGYRRGGRFFRWIGSRGDVAVICLQSNRLGQHDAEIIVDLAVVVVPRVDLFAARGRAVTPGKEDAADGFWRDRLWGPPRPGDVDKIPTQHWGLNFGDAAASAQFEGALREAAIS